MLGQTGFRKQFPTHQLTAEQLVAQNEFLSELGSGCSGSVAATVVLEVEQEEQERLHNAAFRKRCRDEIAELFGSSEEAGSPPLGREKRGGSSQNFPPQGEFRLITFDGYHKKMPVVETSSDEEEEVRGSAPNGQAGSRATPPRAAGSRGAPSSHGRQYTAALYEAVVKERRDSLAAQQARGYCAAGEGRISGAAKSGCVVLPSTSGKRAAVHEGGAVPATRERHHHPARGRGKKTVVRDGGGVLSPCEGRRAESGEARRQVTGAAAGCTVKEGAMKQQEPRFGEGSVCDWGDE